MSAEIKQFAAVRVLTTYATREDFVQKNDFLTNTSIEVLDEVEGQWRSPDSYEETNEAIRQANSFPEQQRKAQENLDIAAFGLDL